MGRLRPILPVLLLAAAAPAWAQQSASFKLEESVFNAGGHPEGAVTPGSASFRLTLGAIGDAVALLDPSSASFRLDGGFVASYPPPGEVLNLRFIDPDTLVWDAEKSTGAYNLYQGDVTDPWAPTYGICMEAELAAETAMVIDVPAGGQALFILVTAENLLSEEGTKGSDSVGTPRPNPAPCP